MFKRTIASVVALVMVCGVGNVAAHADDQAAIKQAKTAADAWLKLVDEGKYQESWNEFASVVKPRITEETWEQEASGVRKPLGAVVSRKVQSATYATSLPGAPYGQYVVILYDTSFENKKSAVENVVPMLDSDGQWRVSGYHIK